MGEGGKFLCMLPRTPRDVHERLRNQPRSIIVRTRLQVEKGKKTNNRMSGVMLCRCAAGLSRWCVPFGGAGRAHYQAPPRKPALEYSASSPDVHATPLIGPKPGEACTVYSQNRSVLACGFHDRLGLARHLMLAFLLGALSWNERHCARCHA